MGWVAEDNFAVEEVETAPLAEGQLLVQNRWLSLDPYMRGRMNDAKSYAAKVELGEVMVGGTVGEVVESRHPTSSPWAQRWSARSAGKAMPSATGAACKKSPARSRSTSVRWGCRA